MKLAELKAELSKYQYLEDTGVIDVALASVIATRLELGEPVWMIIIGPSSGGKSQILRPLAMTDEKFIHRIDDLTENTFLSGFNSKDGEISLLNRIGPLGMIVISDLSVIFSKAPEARAAILSQLRMIYDGEMTKYSGTKKEPVRWKGKLGILAGATPSVYATFEEAAQLGERFIYYRMKDYDGLKATGLALRRKESTRDTDRTISALYEEYIRSVALAAAGQDIAVPEALYDRIAAIASFAEKVRTTSHFDWRGDKIDRIPITAMPMRISQQLLAVATGLLTMANMEGEKELAEEDIRKIEWCAYSLANEEKRRCLRALAGYSFGSRVKTQVVADAVGLSTGVISMVLQALAASNVLARTGDSNSNAWEMRTKDEWEMVRRLESLSGFTGNVERQANEEDDGEMEAAANASFDSFGVK